ncbi:MAG TPA: NADH-ubiquinone oxidoreductase-F iron-sulfur binding region domain-containing protein [Acidimicrobiia bacterium]|nr:NADH-ubiquinone oxidoreductase-F iron-sulfur binding region domain-containing protein [Acidimicrobiia bacterium]
MTEAGYLLSESPFENLDDYRARGGGDGIAEALRIGPEATIEMVTEARLRGRGGAGFPTGIKWSGVASANSDQRRFVVCNAAEGEPGTFKDRTLIRANPYQVLEGLAIAAFAIGAEEAYVGIKQKYAVEVERLESAAGEMDDAGLLGEIPIRLVTGPDDYLLGEEKGLLEAIEGRQPLPRWLPPYVVGLYVAETSGLGAATSGWDDQYNPTVVNNVETLGHVPPLLARGADWFRSHGTEDTPGTVLFTVCGDVLRETVVELAAGTPLAVLVYGIGGGLGAGRKVSAVFPGASNAPLPARLLDTPLDYGSMAAAGSGMGSGGMIVYDDTACVLDAAAQLSRFLAVESCGQCPPCKLGTGALTDLLVELESGRARPHNVEEIVGWAQRVTDANRCGLGAGERSLIAGLLSNFPEVVSAHLDRGCPSERTLVLSKIVDHEGDRFLYDETYFDWRQP